MRNIFKISIIGVVAAILAVFLKKERAEFSTMIGIITGIIIFFYIIRIRYFVVSNKIFFNTIFFFNFPFW